MGRMSFFGQQVNFYLYEVLILLVLLVLLVKWGIKPLREAYQKHKIYFLFFLSLVVSFLVNLKGFSPFENFVSFLYLLRLLMYLSYFSYLSYLIKKQPIFKKTINKGVIIFSVITIITSLTQYFFYPNLRNLSYLGWDPHLYRMFGVFFDTSVTGAIFGLLCLYFYLKNKSDKTYLTNWIFFLIFFIFLILTFSRNAYAAFLAVFIFILFNQRKFKLLFIIIFMFFLFLIIAPKPFGESVNLGRTFSIVSRFEDYKTAIKIWQKKPLLGFGYNRIRYVKKQPVGHSGASFHSSYLIILVTGGLIGLALFMRVLVQLGIMNVSATYLILFLSLLSLSDNIILHPFILFLMLTIINPLFDK